jgi:hypothetical protein
MSNDKIEISVGQMEKKRFGLIIVAGMIEIYKNIYGMMFM